MANVNITKKAIQEAFMAVLDEKPFGKITVKDITNQVEDIISKYPTLNSIEDCLDAAMQSVLENKRAIMHIYNSDNRNTYVSSLWRMCEATVTTYFNTAFTENRLSSEDRQLLIRYHKCECFGLILDWINNGLREDYIEGARRLCQMKKGSVEDMIRRIQQAEGK